MCVLVIMPHICILISMTYWKSLDWSMILREIMLIPTRLWTLLKVTTAKDIDRALKRNLVSFHCSSRVLMENIYSACIFCTAQMCDIMCATGVTLDPVYTFKGVCGMLCEMHTNPSCFQGNRVLYIHTGKPVLGYLPLHPFLLHAFTVMGGS